MGPHLGVQGCGRARAHPRGGGEARHLAAAGWWRRPAAEAGERACGSGRLLAAALTPAKERRSAATLVEALELDREAQDDARVGRVAGDADLGGQVGREAVAEAVGADQHRAKLQVGVRLRDVVDVGLEEGAVVVAEAERRRLVDAEAKTEGEAWRRRRPAAS